MCFYSDRSKDFQVVLGTIDLAKPETSRQTLEVVQTIVHEQYRETPESVYNDIGDHCLLICYCLYMVSVYASIIWSYCSATV